MTKLLYGEPVVEKIFLQTKAVIEKNHIQGYLAIFMLGDNHPGTSYVKKKVEYAEKIGLSTKIFSTLSTVDEDIAKCNMDTECLGIIIQLPLPESIASRQQELLDSITPTKDTDCLGTKLLSQVTIYGGNIDLAPATPSAVMHLLTYYHFHHAIEGSEIAILGESDLIGKPLARILAQYGAYIHTFNEHSNQKHMREVCKESDIIISATGKLHLVDDTFIRPDQSQVIVDVGRGMLDGKATGDVDTEKVNNKIAAITPVPGGVGPITVASLFWNMIKLHESKNLIT